MQQRRSRQTIAEDGFQFLESPHKADTWLRDQVKNTTDVLSNYICRARMAGRIRGFRGKCNDYTIDGCTGAFSIRVKHSREGFRFYIKKNRGQWRFSYALKKLPGAHRMLASKDGRYLVVLADTGGDEIFNISVIDLLAKRELSLVLSPLRLGELQWLEDSSGFVYKPHMENRLVIVKIQSQVQFSIDWPEYMPSTLKLNCFQNKIVITGGAQRATIIDLDQICSTGTTSTIKFDYPLTDRRGRIIYLGSIEQSLIFLDAIDTKYSLLTVTLDENKKVWNTLSLVDGIGIVEDAWLVGERTCIHLYDDRGSTIVIYDRNGTELSNFLAAELGDIHYASECSPDEISIRCSTLTQSSYRIELNFKTDSRTVVNSNDFKTSRVTTGRAYVPIGPNTDIPLTFARCNWGAALKAPTLLEVYGGYGTRMIPSFNPETAVWLDRGGTAVIAHIRGGGEKGNDWYTQAAGNNKQNSVDDIIRVAEWLIENDYCTAKQLGLRGVSHGGLLVAAAIAQRPDLFGAAIIESGPLDLMRRSFFAERSAQDHPDALNEDEEKYARALSPYHNLRRGVTYPPCIVIARQNDGRVSPIHAFKFVAALQAISRNANDNLLLYEPSGGHYASSSPDRGLAEASGWLSFAAHHLGILCYECKDIPQRNHPFTHSSAAPEEA